MPGAFRGFFRKASLWEGIDHILSVRGSRFNEEYHRFYYRDIQALIIEKKARAGSFGWWLILLAALAGAVIHFVTAPQLFPSVVAVVLFVAILVRLEISLRRSCRFFIQTAVSRESLPAIIRRSDALLLIQRLQIRIDAEQGELPTDLPSAKEEILLGVRPPAPDAPAPQVLIDAFVRTSRESAARGVNFAIIALFVLLLNSVFTFWASSGNRSAWIFEVGYAFIAAGLVPIFFSLQSLATVRSVRGLRAFLIAMIVLGALRTIMNLAIASTSAALLRTRGLDFFVLFQRAYVNTNGIIQLVVAAAGLILIFAKWETYRRGDVSSS